MTESANRAIKVQPRDALPAIRIFVGDDRKENTWCPVKDLLEVVKWTANLLLKQRMMGLVLFAFPRQSKSAVSNAEYSIKSLKLDQGQL